MYYNRSVGQTLPARPYQELKMSLHRLTSITAGVPNLEETAAYSDLDTASHGRA